MAKKQAQQSSEITIPALKVRTMDVFIIGTQPLVYNRLSEKARQQLLFPPRASRKTKDRSEEGIKHNPFEEYQNSFYLAGDGPTLCKLPTSALKNALETAALDADGVAKSEVSRGIWLDRRDSPVWGNPALFMCGVRQAGISKTPDIRTRGVLMEWASRFTLNFVEERFTVKTIMILLERAGMLSGIGDFRQEKGAGNFGQFRTTTEEDPEFQRIVASYGREYQLAKYAEPDFFDEETKQLYEWWIGMYRSTFSSSPKHLRQVA